jgi:hypothetical protein
MKGKKKPKKKKTNSSLTFSSWEKNKKWRYRGGEGERQN